MGERVCVGKRLMTVIVDPIMTRVSFSKGSEKFSRQESLNKISILGITEQFYLHIFNMNRGSPHTRSLSCVMQYTSLFLDTD